MSETDFRETFDRRWPQSEAELLHVIREALTFDGSEMTMEEMLAAVEAGTYEIPESYSRSAEAMSKAALAAFNYVAHKVGATGFQASWAELDFLRRSRGLKGPFALLDANDLLYPQYDLRAKVDRYLEEWLPWAADQAREQLADETRTLVATSVEEHWRALAASCPPVCPIEGCGVDVEHGHGTDARYRPREA